MMKPLTLVGFALFAGGIALFLLQMWFQLFDSAIFVKLIITDGALFVIAFVLSFLLRESKESERTDKLD